MFLIKIVVLISILLNNKYVYSKVSDAGYLRDHFITNLVEENRERFSMKITHEIEKSIDLKINAFINEISHQERKRSKRSIQNDLLLNEKQTDITILRGFEKRGVVPINFPQDICMFKINGKSFAVGLNFGKSTSKQIRPENTLLIFKRKNGTFIKVHEYKSLFLTKIGCDSANNIGYVGVLNSIELQMKPAELLKSASFVYRIQYDAITDKVTVTKLQVFAELNQIGVSLWSRDNDIFLIYSYQTEASTPLEKCTVFKLSADNFNPFDTLPCQNAKVIEPFTVNHNFMILIGNYKENNGTTNAFSSLMRYDLTQRRFVEHQKIYTNAITVAKYFFLDHENQRQHFLFIGNSLEIGEFGVVNNDVLSIIYKWVDGFFIPLQTINVTQVQTVSAILGKNNEFNLLISSNDHEVQIYYYDGWKFQESLLDFTGKVFDKGVVSIRSYNDIIEDKTTIIISNENVVGNQWNIYTPIYMKKTDSTRLKQNILDWCSETFSRLDEFNVVEADEMLKNAISIINDSISNVSFSGDVYIEDSMINSVQAEQLQRRNTIFNESSVEKINDLAKRTRRLERDVKKLEEKINFSKGTIRNRRQALKDDEPLIDTLIVDGILDVKRINGKSISNIVYQANRRNNKMKNIIANEIGIKQKLFVDNKVDGVEMALDNILLNLPEQDLRPMKIDMVNIRALDTLKVNEHNFDEFLKLLRRKVDHKIPNMIQQLNVDVLNVKELFNGQNITEIFINSLKTAGTQFINRKTDIKNLYTNGITFDKTLEAISNIPISNLINIKDSKSVKILQDIQFEQEVKANELIIEERINNINVKNGELQALRMRGLTEQVVTGEKYFKVVNLIEPIQLNGRIKSETLEKMNPIATIDKNLILQGDYVIKGPVTISKNLNVSENILSSNDKYSLRNLAENGINLFTTNSSNNKFNFKNIVEVRNNFGTQFINGKNASSFVKTNYEPIQLIEGTKIFQNSLFVGQGTVQADVINDVDLRRLNQTTIKNNQKISQFVDGNVEFERVHVEQAISQTVNIGGKDVKNILNTQIPQTVKKLSTNFMKVQKIQTSNVDHKIGAKIFDHDLNFLINDSISIDSFYQEAIEKKSFENIEVKQLEFSNQSEWKSVISNFNSLIVEELNVTDSFEFEHVMRTGNLQIKGLINGVKYEDMTRYWLKLEGNQTFTAPQTFKFVKVDDNINVKNGLINQFEIDRLTEESIWIDQPVSLNEVEIDGLLEVKERLFTPLVNGATFEEKIILNNTAIPQKFQKLKIGNLATVYDIRLNSINNINLKQFWSFFNGNEEGVNLIVNGNLTLEKANISSLNNVLLKELYDKAWIRTRRTTLFGNGIQFYGDIEIGNVLYLDILNGKNIDDLKANYFSRNADQNINGNLNILGTVTAIKSFTTAKIIVPKFIKINASTLLNMSHFESNILRHNMEQNITGNWRINRLVINGELHGLINGINIPTDVLHTGNIHTAIVTGHKKFKYLEANNVNTKFVNDINIMEWFTKSVALNSSKDQSINGKLTFTKPVRIMNDLKVYGKVNGIFISPDNVFTKSGNQIVKGDVTINNIPHDSTGFKQIFIEHLNLKNGTINGRNWNEFHENAFTKGSTVINSKQIIFNNELEIDSVISDKNIYGVDMKEFLKESSTNMKLMKFKTNMEYLTQVGDDLMRSLAEPVVEMSHFEHHQTIASQNVQNTVLFSFKNDRVTEYVLGIHDRKENVEMIKFYRWNPKDTLFHFDDSITPLEYNIELYQLTQFHKITYAGSDCLFLELIDRINNDTFRQVLLQYDVGIKTFKPVANMNSESSMKVFTWKDGLMPCYGSIRQAFENIMSNCENGLQTTIETRPIRQIWSENNIIVFANDEDKVQVLYEEKFYVIPTVINPASFACIIYHDKLYLAIRSDKADETVHRGDVNIFVSDINDMKFEHLQKLTLNIPTSIQFSKAPSGDLYLYILSRDPTKALNIYSYAGSSNFVDVINESTIIPEASDLDVIQINSKTEVLSVLSNDNVYILQSTVVQY